MTIYAILFRFERFTFLDGLSKAADGLPEDEQEFIQSALPNVNRSKVRLMEYQLAG